MRRTLAVMVLAGCTLGLALSATGGDLPAGFEIVEVVPEVPDIVAIEFSADGRMFVAITQGTVWVWENGVQQEEPFIDLSDEVRGPRGMFGMVLDPDFINNRHVYVTYIVDPIFGPPDEPHTMGSFSRVTRYTGTLESNGNVADPASRTVLIGATIDEGPTVCAGHAGADLVFGHDGSLFIGFGDGAHQIGDPGGLQPDCFPPNDPDYDIGSFRAQYMSSLSGKMLRVDPATGLGLVTNPYYTGDPTDVESRIWASGFRQPFRFTVRPDLTEGPPTPGALYICDVGWATYEEVNLAFGGENFGWPCHEGPIVADLFPDETPPHGGCDTIETAENPGPLTEAAITIHHEDDTLSSPAGHISRAVTGVAFYTAPYYPDEYLGLLFVCDVDEEWLKVADFDDQHQLVSFDDFGTVIKPIDLTIHPLNGDVYWADRTNFAIKRLRYSNNIDGDTNGDGTVGVEDLLFLLTGWGPCWGCPQDVNGDGVVNTTDLLAMLANWGLRQ